MYDRTIVGTASVPIGAVCAGWFVRSFLSAVLSGAAELDPSRLDGAAPVRGRWLRAFRTLPSLLFLTAFVWAGTAGAGFLLLEVLWALLRAAAGR